MNNKIYKRAINKALKLKPNIPQGKAHHITAAVYKSRIICIAVNNYGKLHNEKKFGKYENIKGFSTPYVPCIHSEIGLLVKLGETDLSDYELLNVRIDNHNNVNLSKSCDNCAKVLKGFSPKRVFYSDAQGNLQEDERF